MALPLGQWIVGISCWNSKRIATIGISLAFSMLFLIADRMADHMPVIADAAVVN